MAVRDMKTPGLRAWSAPLLVAAAAGLMPMQQTARAEDAEARARDVVSKMTLDEKISQMHGTQTKEQYRVVLGVPRLGIPDLLVTNGPAGFGPAGPGHSSKATALPAPIALASSWDVAAAKEYGVIEGSEAVDGGNTFFEAPDVNIARVPQNGRTFEAYGEDPYLAGRLSVANIQGIQSQGIIANVKHFAANSQETERFTVNEEIDERTLREIYLPAFEMSVTEGKVASVMAAYNKINGTHCCENAHLLKDILKGEWGFQGFVSSDFWAVHSTVPTAMNGLDLEMPNGQYFGAPLKKAVEDGTVPVAVIDEHLVRRFKTMMEMGVWDHLPAHREIPAKKNGESARRMAEEGCVLLRNDGGLLPLDARAIKTIALIGPYATKASTGGGGSSEVSPVYTVTPLEGLQKRAGESVQVTLLDGKDVEAAVAAAKAADVAIVMVGDRATEGKDHSLELQGNQDALVEAIAGANPRTIVVLKTGSPVLMPWAEKPAAILEAWYPGEEDGNVVAAVLFGDVNPSGKLPITFPRRPDDLPAHTEEQYPGTGEKGHTVVKYSEGVLVGYRWFDAKDIQPLYPFGYGLSYTTYSYGNLKLSAETLDKQSPHLGVDFDVTNSGKRDGVEVVEAYVGIPGQPGVEEPPHQLKGFARIAVDAGKTEHVHIDLNGRAFSYWDVESHGWKIAPGDYTINVGASSRDIKLTGHVRAE